MSGNQRQSRRTEQSLFVVNKAANSILGAQLVQTMGLDEVHYDQIQVIDDPSHCNKNQSQRLVCIANTTQSSH